MFFVIKFFIFSLFSLFIICNKSHIVSNSESAHKSCPNPFDSSSRSLSVFSSNSSICFMDVVDDEFDEIDCNDTEFIESSNVCCDFKDNFCCNFCI